MTRSEAIRHLIGTGLGISDIEALQVLGVSDSEIRTARKAIRDDQRREWAERMSPDWRGEEMGN